MLRCHFVLLPLFPTAAACRSLLMLVLLLGADSMQGSSSSAAPALSAVLHAEPERPLHPGPAEPIQHARISNAALPKARILLCWPQCNRRTCTAGNSTAYRLGVQQGPLEHPPFEAGALPGLERAAQHFECAPGRFHRVRFVPCCAAAAEAPALPSSGEVFFSCSTAMAASLDTLEQAFEPG